MLIVNKYCAIFTTSITRTLGKVPKEDKWYEVYGQLYDGLTSSTSRFLVRDNLVPGFFRVWWWRFNSVSTPLLFFRWPIVLSPLYTTKCSFFDSFLVLSDNSYAVYWNSSFGGQSDSDWLNGYYIMAGNSEEMELKDSAAPGSPQQNYDSLKELNANNGKHNNFLLLSLNVIRLLRRIKSFAANNCFGKCLRYTYRQKQTYKNLNWNKCLPYYSITINDNNY